MGLITDTIISGIIVSALSPSVNKVGKFVVDQVPVLAKDYFFLWQRKNAEVVGNRVRRILQERGYSEAELLRIPSPKFACNFVQGASVEDDPKLQELWASLLANALDPNFNEELHAAYFSIIKDLSSLDVRVIRELQIQSSHKPRYTFGDGWPEIDYITEFATELNEDKNNIDVSFENLFRLRIVDNKNSVNVVASSHPNMQGEKRKTESALHNRYPYFTSLGLAFIKACVNETKNRTANAPE